MGPYADENPTRGRTLAYTPTAMITSCPQRGATAPVLSLGRWIPICLAVLLLGACSEAQVPEPSSYRVAGTVSGLEGTGLVLQNNGGDDLPVTGSGTVPFVFETAVNDLESYEVTVLTQPTGLSQTCVVSNGSSTVSGGDVEDVSIACVTNTFVVSADVDGLAGSGLVLQNNGGDDLEVILSETRAFDTALTDGAAYEVSVLTQPSAPQQTCTVTDGVGTVAGSDVTAFVTCATDPVAVGGTVGGATGGAFELDLNGEQQVSVFADGSFVFDPIPGLTHPLST